MPDFETLPDGFRRRVLVKPLETPGDKKIAAVRLAPPRYSDIMSLGDPSTLLVLDGAVLPQNDPATIKAYVDRLLRDDAGEVMMPALLEQADYRDALAIRDAVLDFFRQGSANKSTTTQTS